MTPPDPSRRAEVKTQHVYRCAKCRADVAFIARLPAWLEEHLLEFGHCGGRLIYLRETENMSEHKIEREAVLWAFEHIYQQTPTEEQVTALLGAVLTGDNAGIVAGVAIAYVEAAKNHIDMVLELETNLARATEELVSLRTIAAYYRMADYNQRRCANTGTAEAYRKAAEAMDKALGGGSGGT